MDASGLDSQQRSAPTHQRSAVQRPAAQCLGMTARRNIAPRVPKRISSAWRLTHDFCDSVGDISLPCLRPYPYIGAASSIAPHSLAPSYSTASHAGPATGVYPTSTRDRLHSLSLTTSTRPQHNLRTAAVMAKAKSPTPQEVYRARKQREEQEKLALLPPGLVNHGNTCFMNSVLQGLLATQLLSLLVHRSPIPPSIQAHASTLLDPRRSPQLMNGERNWGVPMPVGEAFLGVMTRAWEAEYAGRRESMSPKPILAALGKKYDQYLDFAQQDAHEFLRILLDAMGMEELDAIKKTAPPQPQSISKRRRRVSVPKPADDAPMSLADMIFGGKLASILVCQKCKHVSHTYEAFNDLSLSIKSEDYQGAKKRDRFKNFAKKLAVSVSLGGSASSLALEPQPPIPRPSSVPPSPAPREGDAFADVAAAEEGRRKSLDLPPDEHKFDGERVADVPPEDRHIEFVEQPKVEKKPSTEKKDKDDDAWTKLGRRLSLGLGSKGSKDRERKGRSAERASRDLSYAALRPNSLSAAPRSGSPDTRLSPGPSGTTTPKSRPTTPSTSPLTAQTFTVSPPPAKADSLPPRSKSPKPPKPTPGEAAYLRRILADVASGSAGDAAAAWLKLGGGLPGVEECLRMFTAVEVLDGENSVGCRRCWKIANGQYVPKVRPPDDCGPPEESEDSADNADSPVVTTPIGSPHPHPHRPPLPMSISTPAIPVYSRSTPESTSSLPLVTPPSSSSDSAVAFDDSDTMTPPSSASSVHSLPSAGEDEEPATPPATPAHVTIIPPTPITGGAFDVTVSVTDSDGQPALDAIEEGVEPKPAGLHPPNHHNRGLSDESSDGSSGDESDVSVISAKEVPADKTPPSLAPKPKKTPKPVLMQPAYKRYLIAHPPPVLVIHLKRFQQLSKHKAYMSFSTGFKKLDDYVAFPERLDLAPYLAPKKEDYGLRRGKGKGKGKGEGEEGCVYRLYAVVVHIGNMLGGHYISYVALPAAGEIPRAGTGVSPPTTPRSPATPGSPPAAGKDARQWAYISDTVVRLTTLEEVLKAKAYICMYERV
ncbi:USP domain-containing protein [Mycena indigotica]|uniref:ubiquitinyl hydrolase 1 n=1 Tax=Mycena indigotica TaxID=2126181 RepID=A0A8H6T7T8_9AGAR|nr:USP domain-containing protein [Mycena indigotica]KAF7311801.1 USP domain-containing protein [Mycena indigotica]